MLPTKRISVVLMVLGLVAMFGVACGKDEPVGAEADSGLRSEQSNLPLATQTNSGDPSSSNTAEDGVVSNSGPDPECVALVLGRDVTNFADVTDAERTRIFSEWSAGAPALGGPDGEIRGVGFDSECMEEAIGVAATDVRELTPEQRTQVFEACGSDVFGGAAGGFTGRPGGIPGGIPGSMQGNAGFTDLFDAACMEDALGHAVDDVTQLTAEEQRLLFTECAPEGFGEVIPGGGAGGFGGGAGGPFGDGTGGRFGGAGDGQTQALPN